MAASPVSICSNALLLLGAKPIASFTEATDRARLAANLYPSQRDEFMREHPWNACITRVVLAPEANPPAFGFSHSFLLPGDFIRVLDIGDRCDLPDDYRVERKRILFNGTVLKLRYISDTDEGSWDKAMVTVMELRMAAAMAYPITQSAALADSMNQQAQQALRKAKTLDGQEDPPQELGDSPLLQSRYSGGGWHA